MRAHSSLGRWRRRAAALSAKLASRLAGQFAPSTTTYFTRAGGAYAGANHQMVRSADHGLTWEAVGPSFPDGYYQVIGDGNVLYAQESNTGANSVGPQPYITSPETDGKTWSPYQGGAQTFADGPYSMRFDPIRRVLYSSNWRTGVWALKVL